MNEAQAIELISAAFAAQWPAASGHVPFVLENRTLNRVTPPVGADTFAFLTTQHTLSEQRTSGDPGTRYVERAGWIVVKLWGPAGAGRAGTAALAGAVRAIFEMARLDPPDGSESLDTLASLTTEIGTDGRWYMTMVRTPFSYFETK